MKIQDTNNRGFTIIEMMVAVALFAIVMIIAVGALLSLVTANRKAQALQSVINNLNTTVDSMVRQIREGSNYHCDDGTGSVATISDCPNGKIRFAFERLGGDTSDSSDQMVYQFVDVASQCGAGYTGGCIMRSANSGAPGTWAPVTAPEVAITSMTFYVVGTTPRDTAQPKAVVVIKGVAGGGNIKITTTFHIQSTAVQRVLDI